MQPNSFHNYYSQWRSRIHDALDRYTSQMPDGCPDQLREAMRYSLLQEGKKIRSLLVLMACETCGGNPDDALPAACAVEMIHTFSLIHDDLPAMDDDDLRRGQLTNHKVHGETQAILAGDGLLAFAFSILSREITSPDVASACCSILADATGPWGMVGGQSDDMNGSKDLNIEQIESLHKRKTGALIQASVMMGAEIAGASDVQKAALETYASCIGLAFQITDDLLDVQSTEDEAGKAVGKDALHGKITFPALLGVEESQQKADQLIQDAIGALEIFGDEAQHLRSLAESILHRSR